MTVPGPPSGEAFFFGIPLIARAAAGNWALVDRLLALTLRSVLGQVDRDFQVVLAGHDVPPAWRALAGRDPRFTFVGADWTPEPPTQANDDGGRKKWLIEQHVRALGGGHLMFLDADDWVHRDLVRCVRARVGPGDVGAIVAQGYAFDWPSRRAARFPVAGGFDGRFHELCGSSTIARIEPASADSVRRDPHAALGWHSGWDKVAARLDRSLVSLDLDGVYLVGTEQSHSERQGPYAEWRRGFARAVRVTGKPLGEAEWRCFGLDPDAVAPDAA